MLSQQTRRRDGGRHRQRQRKGVALVLSVVLMFVLFAFLAFSVDTGFIAKSQAEMRRTADAAAMAGCWELFNQMRTGVEGSSAYPAVRTVASSYAGLNPVNQSGPQLDTTAGSTDVQIGYLSSLQSSSISNNPSHPFFAVRANVTKSRTKNGEIPFFFGRIFGNSGRDMNISATAVMARNISGFELPAGSSETIDILPFALDKQTCDELLAGIGGDQYCYHEGTNGVTMGADGFLECNLYPQGVDAPGNRGTVDIGASGNSTNDIKRQILYGISSQDMLDLGKPLSLSGGTMTLEGDTGISAAVKAQLTEIIGEPRCIPVFSSVSGNGNNAVYTICQWLGIRVMYVKLTGSMKSKQVIVQLCPFNCPYATYSTDATQYSNYVYTPVMLAR